MTRLSTATFVDFHGKNFGGTVEKIWLAFSMPWFLMYTAYPNRLRTNQGSVYKPSRWRQITDLNGVQLGLFEI